VVNKVEEYDEETGTMKHLSYEEIEEDEEGEEVGLDKDDLVCCLDDLDA